MAPARLWLIAPLLGTASSLLILALRNLYDDELGSYELILKPIGLLWSEANHADVHPPGMYLLGYLAHALIGSERWMALVPLAIWLGGVAVFVRACMPLLKGCWRRTGFALLAFLHPQALMWSSSIRWYSSWSGIALLIVSLLLLPRVDEPPSARRCALAGVLAGLSLYLSYLTLPLAACLCAAFFVRYGPTRLAMSRGALALVIGTLVSAPQLGPFWHVHLPGASRQQFPLLVSASRLAYGLSVGEALLPWHPVAILAVVVVLLPGLIGLGRAVVRERWFAGGGDRRKPALLVLLVGLIAIGVFGGLGGRPRSFIVAVPLIALFVPIGLEAIPSRIFRALASVIAAAWLGTGIYHLAARTGTAKAGMNDHPEEVVAGILALAAGRPAVVFTHDPGLTYALHRATLRGALSFTVCSIFEDAIHDLPSGRARFSAAGGEVFVVSSHSGLLGDRAESLKAALAMARETIEEPREVYFGRDPDFAWKQQLGGSALPEYSVAITYGRAQDIDYAGIGRAFKRIAKQ